MTVDYVVKLGGSLLVDLDTTTAFLRKAAALDARSLFTVGSGPLGDAFKAIAYDSGITMPFHLAVDCWSGIQSINARLIASLDASYVPCGGLREIEECIARGERPIVDAKDFSNHFQRLRHQMSDVRSVLIAALVGCERLVIFTDVEGVFSSDPRVDPLARKLTTIAADDPVLRSRTSVDEGLAEQLTEHRVTAFVTGIRSFLHSDLAFADYLAAHSSVISPSGRF